MFSKRGQLAQAKGDVMTEKTNQRPAATDPARVSSALEHIRQALEGLRFGEVSVIVQDGVVVQLERKERTRLQR